MIYRAIILLLFIAVSVYSQKVKTKLFDTDDILNARLYVNRVDLISEFNDTVFFKNNFYYENIDCKWEDVKVKLRARGNFRRSTCDYAPIKLKVSKKEAKGTIFKGNRKLKLVLPCIREDEFKNDNVVKEFLVYKLYSILYPYSLKVKFINLEYIDLSKEEGLISENLNAFFIEDYKKMAEAKNARPLTKFIHGIKMDDLLSIKNSLFQYMIGNVDFSASYKHNIKVIQIEDKTIPVSYDFDMSGFVDPSYALHYRSNTGDSLTNRKYNGYERDEKYFYEARDFYLSKEEEILEMLNSYEDYFENTSKYDSSYSFIKSFFKILKDDALFQQEIIDKAIEDK